MKITVLEGLSMPQRVRTGVYLLTLHIRLGIVLHLVVRAGPFHMQLIIKICLVNRPK